jgi:hypothetical protein
MRSERKMKTQSRVVTLFWDISYVDLCKQNWGFERDEYVHLTGYCEVCSEFYVLSKS